MAASRCSSEVDRPVVSTGGLACVAWGHGEKEGGAQAGIAEALCVSVSLLNKHLHAVSHPP